MTIVRSTAGNRLIIFGDSRTVMSAALVEAAIRAARARRDIEVVAVCDVADPSSVSRRAVLRRAATPYVRRLFDPEQPGPLDKPVSRTVASLARREGVRLVAPAGTDVNEPSFVARLRGELECDLALSLGCLRIFSPAVLDSFRGVVNHHNGLLPAYGGLRATAWSLYNGEPRTGFTYHRMTAAIDAGPILVQGSLTVGPGDRSGRLEAAKTRLAAARLDDVLSALVAGDPGLPQPGGGSYFGHAELRRITTIREPSSLAWAELRRRMRAFEALTMRLAGASYAVTKLVRLEHGEPGRSGLAFRTSDGVRVEPVRFGYLPLRLARLYRSLGRRP